GGAPPDRDRSEPIPAGCLGSRLILLGDQENGLAPNTGGDRITFREHPTQDRPRPGGVHLLQGVDRRHLHVVILAGATTRAARPGRAPRVITRRGWCRRCRWC